MSDKEKEKAEDEDRDDAPEGDDDDASVKAKSKAKSDAADDAPGGDDDDASVKAKSKAKSDAADDAGESEGSDDDGDEGAAGRVAAALGVDDGEAAPEEGAAEAKEEEEPAAPANRAARRREEALERRRKRKGLPAKQEGEAALPKDKNKRAKELLARRRESAVPASQEPATLEAGEMVDDALSRMWAGSTKWLRKNLTAVQWVIAAGVVVGASYVGYTYYTQKTLGAASDVLAAGVSAEEGHIFADDKRADEDKEIDPTPVFKTADERAEAALAAYRDVQAKHAGSGAAILAKLGEAGVLLDKRDFDKAIEAFEAVQKTPLAAADVDVRARCIEGVGLAKEGKGDADGAMAAFKTLEAVDARGFKELAQYHQARLMMAKNTDDDRAKAKDLLKTVYDKLKAPSVEAKPSVYLEHAVESALKTLDPSAVPDRDSLQGMRGGAKSKEELEAQIRKIQEQLGKKQGDGDGH